MIKVYCDGGGSRRTQAYYAYIVMKDGIIIHKCAGILQPGTSSNEAEYEAVISALSWIRWYGKEFKSEGVEILTDSLLVTNQINHIWKCGAKNLRQLRFIAFFRLSGAQDWITIRWIPREENMIADALGRMIKKHVRR